MSMQEFLQLLYKNSIVYSASGREEALNPGPDYNTSALNISAMLPPFKVLDLRTCLLLRGWASCWSLPI